MVSTLKDAGTFKPENKGGSWNLPGSCGCAQCGCGDGSSVQEELAAPRITHDDLASFDVPGSGHRDLIRLDDRPVQSPQVNQPFPRGQAKPDGTWSPGVQPLGGYPSPGGGGGGGQEYLNENLDAKGFKKPCCGGCAGRGECAAHTGGRRLTVTGGGEGQGNAGGGRGSNNDGNSSIEVMPTKKKCTSLVIMHVWVNPKSNCKKKIVDWVRDQIKAGAKKKLTKRHACSCRLYNHYNKKGLQGTKRKCEKVPETKPGCKYDIKLRLHKKKGGDKKDGRKPIEIKVVCEPGSTADHGVTVAGRRITLELSESDFATDASRGWDPKNAAMWQGLTAHELGHNLFDPLPGSWYPDDYADPQKAGHNQKPGLMSAGPKTTQQIIDGKLSAREKCELVCVHEICDMKECCPEPPEEKGVVVRDLPGTPAAVVGYTTMWDLASDLWDSVADLSDSVSDLRDSASDLTE